MISGSTLPGSLVQRWSIGAPLAKSARRAPLQAAPLRRAAVPDILQLNIGLYCNQACRHCHVESSPLRTAEVMSRATAEQALRVLEASPSVRTVDLTGGAPELNPQFRFLVEGAAALGRTILDRCNLTVLLEPGQEDLPEFLAAKGVRVVASLPCYTGETVDKQRGGGYSAGASRACGG